MLEELDPVTLISARTVRAPGFDLEAFRIGVANDGKVLIETGSSSLTGAYSELFYSPLRREFGQLLDPLGGNPPFALATGTTAASGDGSLVLVSQERYSRAARYVSGSLQTQFAAPTLSSFSVMRINRRGTLLLANLQTALDGSLAPLGQIPNSSSAAAVAPELPRAYTFDSDGTIRTFDTSQPAIAGVLAVVPPALTLVAAPGGPVGLQEMTVSPDGRTLFIAGRARIVVQPLAVAAH